MQRHRWGLYRNYGGFGDTESPTGKGSDMGKKKKNQEFEVTPISVNLPMTPVDGVVDFRGNVPKVKARKFVSANVSIGQAISDTSSIVELHRKRYYAGDESAAACLVKINPCFYLLPWVQEAACKALLRGGVTRKAGRRKGDGLYDGLHIVALVKNLEKTRCSSTDRAFHFLSEKIGLSYVRIKAQYYDALKDSRLKAFVVQTGPASILNRREVDALLAGDVGRVSSSK